MENKTDKFISACAASDGIYSRGSCGVRVRYPIGRSRAWVELRARRQSLLPDRRSWCRTDEARCVGAVLGNAEGHKWSWREGGRKLHFWGACSGRYRVYSYPWKQEVQFLLWRGSAPTTDSHRPLSRPLPVVGSPTCSGFAQCLRESAAQAGPGRPIARSAGNRAQSRTRSRQLRLPGLLGA